VVLPHRASRKQDVSYLIKLRVIKRFEFTSQTMKSGALVVPEDAPAGTALLLVKGAPSVIKHMAKPGSVPENFDRVKYFLLEELYCAVVCSPLAFHAARFCAFIVTMLSVVLCAASSYAMQSSQAMQSLLQYWAAVGCAVMSCAVHMCAHCTAAGFLRCAWQ